MPLPPTVRFAAWAAAGLVCAGCGRDAGWQHPSPPAAPPAVQAREAPRQLIAPTGAKPLLVLKPELPAIETGNPPVQALRASLNASAPRIVELGASPNSSAANTIRQPGAVATQLPAAQPLTVREPSISAEASLPAAPAAERSRSAFVPHNVPPPAQPPTAAELPQLAQRPDFNQPRAPAAWSPPGVQMGTHLITQSQSPPPQPQQPTNYPPQIATAPSSPPPAAARPADGMNAVAQQAQLISDRGLAMAQRGMLFAGRAELTKALQLIAQALDVQSGANTHVAALASGLTALKEAGDFAAQGQGLGAVDVAKVALAHQTPLLKGQAAANLSPVVAQQQYYGFAQSQLVAAAGGQPAASQVLYRLGRLQTALAAHDAAPQALHGPQAIVFQQAALAIDGNNYLAANELGVLLARYGQLATARDLLAHSVSIRPQVESWHNLSVVHRRLGEVELARQADRERELLAQKSGGSANRAGDLVRWVDTRTFAATGSGDTPWPEAASVKSAATSTPAQRR